MNRSCIFLFILIAIAACKKPENKTVSVDTSGATYFSITQFAADQFNTFGGQPYSLQKVVTLNGKRDSTLESALTMDWASVLKPFLESDISDKKYLDQYHFSMFEDNITDTRNFFYEAKDPKLFTKKLQISSNAENNKIQSIYIETEKNGKVQKLFYKPVKLIQIQEFETSFLGKDKDLRVEYIFM